MKTLKTLSILVFLLCSFYSNAQIVCGVQAEFYQDLNPNNVPTFHDTSSVSPNWHIVSWHWDFGDGNQSTLQNPSHYYTTPGTYTVCEIVVAEGLGTVCSDTFCKTITAPCNTVAGNFTWTTSGFVVSFAGQFSSNYPPLTYAWIFGDGSAVSNVQNPVHTYTTAGTYNVCVEVTDANGCTKRLCHTVNVPYNTNCGNVQANFSITSNGGGTVVLQSTSTGAFTGTLYQWWMDGTALTNPNPNTAFTLTNVGNGSHRFCLYIYANNISTFCDSTCKTETISSNPCTISAGFQFTLTSGTANFFPVHNSVPTFNYWVFGDGTVSNDTGVVHHTYPSNPNNVSYRVCHYVGISGTACIDTVCETIVIPGTGGGGCNASFVQTVLSGGRIRAESTSTGVDSTTQYAWYIWGPNNVVVYTQTGTNNITSPSLPSGGYKICLYLYSSNQTLCDSTCHTITIANSNPCAGITSAWASALIGIDSMVFEAADTNSSANHYWNFGDGTTGTGTRVVHQYPGPGTYNVCFYVYIPNTNCVDSLCRSITIPNGPCGGLSANWTQTYVSGGAVHFVGSNTSLNVAHHWNFGDGTTSTANDPTHCYPTAGLFNVCHIVTIPGTICADTNCHQIQATACNPCIGFGVHVGWGPNSSLGGFNVEASLNSPPPTTPTTYVWSNGDSGRVIRVLLPGVYCVTATNANGCSATACDSVGGSNTCNMAVTITPQSSGGVHVLTAHATGGTAPYTFSWNNGLSTSNVLTVTAPGTYCVIVRDVNQCVADACFTIHANPGTDTICGVIFEDANGNGVMDSTELGIPNAEVRAGNYVIHADSFGHYFLVVPAGTYSIVYCARTGYTYTIPVSPNNNGLNCNGYYQVVINGGGMHCGFDFGVQNNSVSICGIVYLDANNNQVRDIGENGVANVHLEIVSSTGHVYHAYTNQNGEYCKLVPVGTYTIHAASGLFNTCPITPQSISVTATTPGQHLNGNNFAAYCQPGLCNLMVNITPHTTVTAGFPAWYSIQVCNVGSSVSGGTLNMFYDPALTFDHASPVQTSHNASTRTISWNVNNILPGNCRYFWAYLDANTNITLHQSVFKLVNITPDTSCNDVNMVNNVDTVHQRVTASWDPNNKLAYTTNHETDPRYQWVSSIDANQRLEYVINFQNKGNAPAINVVVKDLISSDLDLSSFELLGTSHAGLVTMDGSELNFKFSGIMLAAESIDEPNSHGWVKFAIRSVNGLQGGHIIADEADIYFDYNLPVTTNDAAVIMLDATGIDEVAVSNVTVVIAPNPMSQLAEIRLNNTKADNFRFRVTDLTGRVVAEKISAGSSLMFERDALAAGLYTYQVIQNNSVVAKGKLVAE